MDFSSFQIIHDWGVSPVKEIGNCIKKIFEAYYKEVSEKECESYISVRYNYHSNGTKYICGFDLSANLDSYSLFDHQSFYNLLKDELLGSDQVDSVIKLNDDSRLEEYTLYYQQIANMEMRLREVITFILSDCLNGGYYKLLESQKPNPMLKGVALTEKETILKERSENELFYLTFNQYRNIVIPDFINATYLKELTDRLTGEALKDGLSKLRIFNTEHFRNFLASIQDDLSSVEQFRNCIAHNRKFSDKEWGNYDKAYANLDSSLKSFWEALIEKADDVDEFSYFEDEAYSGLKPYMENAKWHYRKKEVHIPIDLDDEHYKYDKIDSFDELTDYLADKAYNIATAYFPSDDEFRVMAEESFNGYIVVKKLLQNYEAELKKMKW